MKARNVIAILAAGWMIGCAGSGNQRERGAPDPTPSASSETGAGLSREAALEVCEPGGEREYLSRLRCADGSAPEFERSGSVGLRNNPANAAEEEKVMGQFDGEPLPEGQIDYHVLDLYEVRCGERTYEVFMDMYHCGQPPPELAPPGLTLARGQGMRS